MRIWLKLRKLACLWRHDFLVLNSQFLPIYTVNWYGETRVCMRCGVRERIDSHFVAMMPGTVTTIKTKF